jgi:riboflavin synthase
MFTGIVQAVGRIEGIEPLPAGRRFTFALGDLAGRRFGLGDSIAVNGACLTVVALPAGAFASDVSNETLRVTTLGGLAPGAPAAIEPEGGTVLAGFSVPEALARYFARKGSICVDGVSLTVNRVAGTEVGVTLVPHTLAHTIMHTYRPGTAVNVEVDLVARYVERLLASER